MHAIAWHCIERLKVNAADEVTSQKNEPDGL